MVGIHRHRLTADRLDGIGYISEGADFPPFRRLQVARVQQIAGACRHLRPEMRRSPDRLAATEGLRTAAGCPAAVWRRGFGLRAQLVLHFSNCFQLGHLYAACAEWMLNSIEST